MTGRVFVARHGETVLNALGRVQGWCDSPLTAQGRLEAIALGRALANAGARISHAWSADGMRHRETAALALAGIAPQVEARHDARWREFAFGSAEGAEAGELWRDLVPGERNRDAASRRRSGAEVLEALQGLPAAARHPVAPVESLADVQARTRDAWEEVTSANGDALVVTSGLTLLALLGALRIDVSALDAGIANGAMLTLRRGDRAEEWLLDTGVPVSAQSAGAQSARASAR